jgi:putative flavoprotein involved in K+ transport
VPDRLSRSDVPDRLSRSDVPDRLSRSDVPDQLSPGDGGFRVETSHGELRANRVVVATGGYQTPVVPDFADELAPGIQQLHSCAYRNPGQLDGTVLVVGAGNSGAEIALESIRAGHPTWLSGRHPGQVPFRIETRMARVLVPILMFVFRRVLTLDTPLGRKIRGSAIMHGTPLVRTKLSDLQAAGVHQVGRIAGVRNGLPVTVDGVELQPQTVGLVHRLPARLQLDRPARDRRGGSPDHHAWGLPGNRPVLHWTGVPVRGRVVNHPGPGSGRSVPDARHGDTAQRPADAGDLRAGRGLGRRG